MSDIAESPDKKRNEQMLTVAKKELKLAFRKFDVDRSGTLERN